MEVTDRRLNSRAFDESPHLMAVVAFDGVLKVVNAAWERALGYRADELVGRALVRLVDDTDRATALRLINPRAAAGDPGPLELALRCKDGTYRDFEWERRRVAAEQSIFIVGKDVTDRKKLEVTDKLKMYELYAQAAKMRKSRETGSKD